VAEISKPLLAVPVVPVVVQLLAFYPEALRAVVLAEPLLRGVAPVLRGVVPVQVLRRQEVFLALG